MKKERLFGKEPKWEGEEHPDDGGGRLEKLRGVAIEQLDTNGISCKVKYRHYTSQTSLLSPCFGDSLSTKLHLTICGNLGHKVSGFHGLHPLVSAVKSVYRKKYINQAIIRFNIEAHTVV